MPRDHRRLYRIRYFEAHYENDAVLIPLSEVPRLERALRIHLDLGVNTVGIDIISNLLGQLERQRFNTIDE